VEGSGHCKMKVLSQHVPGGIVETSEKFIHDRQCPGRDSNRTYPDLLYVPSTQFLYSCCFHFTSCLAIS
jgi:hypothetical protein